jgi:hypothetical protein
MGGNCITNLLDGEVGQFELVAVGIEEHSGIGLLPQLI